MERIEALLARDDLKSVVRNEEAKVQEHFGTVTDSPMCIGGEGVLHQSQALRDAGVTHVLTVAADVTVPAHIPKEFRWLRVPVYDSPDEGKFLDVLPECLEFINGASRAGGKCYVHCMYGVSRSAAIVVAWLMQRGGSRYGQEAYQIALTKLKHDWPDASPSYWFSKHLSDGPSPPRRHRPDATQSWQPLDFRYESLVSGEMVVSTGLGPYAPGNGRGDLSAANRGACARRYCVVQ